MLSTETQRLVTINLKYSSQAKPLKTLAFAQLAAKVLYLAGDPLDLQGVADLVADSIGVTHVSPDLVRAGLEYLKDIRHASEEKGRWSITEGAKHEIATDLTASETS